MRHKNPDAVSRFEIAGDCESKTPLGEDGMTKAQASAGAKMSCSASTGLSVIQLLVLTIAHHEIITAHAVFMLVELVKKGWHSDATMRFIPYPLPPRCTAVNSTRVES